MMVFCPGAFALLECPVPWPRDGEPGRLEDRGGVDYSGTSAMVAAAESTMVGRRPWWDIWKTGRAADEECVTAHDEARTW